MFAQLLCHSTQTNAREVVDREARILGVVHRKHIPTGVLHLGVLEPFDNSCYPHIFHDLAEHDLDEDATRARRIVFIHFDDLEHSPSHGVRGEHVPEETRDVSQAVGFVAMYCVIVLAEAFLESVSPNTVELAELFPYEAVVLAIGTFL